MATTTIPTQLLTHFKSLHQFSIRLASERDPQRLLQETVAAAMQLSHAEGGSLYLKQDNALHFAIMRNDGLGLAYGGPGQPPPPYPPVPLYGADGQPNLESISAQAALRAETVAVADAYALPDHGFALAKEYDQAIGYCCRSFLSLSMKNQEGECVGVLTLINARGPDSDAIRPFNALEQQMLDSLASQAAIAYNNLQLLQAQVHLLDAAKHLNQVGIALSSEKNSKRLLEMILEAAKNVTRADGGTLYLKEGDALKFEIMLSTSLRIHKGGSNGEPIPFAPLLLRDAQGNENRHMVAVYSACTQETVNIPDAYTEKRFNFSGTRAFDKQTGYRSQSFLTVPMMDYENELIGILQLINAQDANGAIIPFSAQQQELVESLASQAAVALVNQRLIEEHRELFNAFIHLIAGAIDEKSPYTGGHCQRVPELTMMLAEAVARTTQGPAEVREFTMREEDRYELKVAGLLHDCGKITTKEYVVDKATKLETIVDRIHFIAERMEILRRDVEIRQLRKQIHALRQGQTVDEAAQAAELQSETANLMADLAFLRECNVGGESMSDERMARVDAIATRTWHDANGEAHPFLTPEEVNNLKIFRGTLTAEERNHINHHIVATIRMLEALPYPKYLKNVPKYAGGHHERMDGKGYPNRLTRAQMPLQARIMGIADIFEALTAGDRPYKKAMKLSTALTILGKMKLDQHIDPDLFDVFIREKVYLEYAQRFLRPEQIDDVNVTQLPGYAP